ncbi:9567_t:CDS:10 [Acaulospora morrowiae]|uniref:9567_t:CDS:1 n=1 Tax=Acaulospora morrowiae TaxID=94023 RepID=A0A9N9GNS5_9GLOM|nr:9567_t:CDS:10 [Acaulospora morrowiae]
MKDITFTTSDCISKPLEVVKTLIGESNSAEASSKKEYDVPTFFQNVFATEESMFEIPSLNDTHFSDIPHCTLVRFRAMIQNTGLGHEMFVSSYETLGHDGHKQWKFNKYSDDMDVKDEILDLNAPGNQFDERHLYYCNYAYKKRDSSSIGIESSIEAIVRSTANLNLNNDKGTNIGLEKLASKFPFPNEDHVAAIVKIYDKDDSLKVTDVVEFIGVLAHPSNEMDSQGDEFSLDAVFSSIPCLHAIFYRNVYPSGNPLESRLTDLNVIQSQANRTRSSLLQYISSALGGDELVAEFVLLQLLSRIYNRRNGLTLGKLVLNISNVPSTCINTEENSLSSGLIHSNQYSKRIAAVLESLLPKYHDLPLTLSTLNELYYYPRSNEELDSGVFQVSQGTWFLIDETVMKEGKLGDIGVRNLQVLNEILDNQKLKYTFPFNDFELETDIGVIILSDAKSFLPVDCIIPLLGNPEETLMLDVREDLLIEFRNYLSILRCAEFSIPDDVSEYIQNEFVRQRKNASISGHPLMTQADLLLRMTLARLVTLSFGRLELTTELWDYTQKLDEQRKQRIVNFEQRP